MLPREFEHRYSMHSDHQHWGDGTLLNNCYRRAAMLYHVTEQTGTLEKAMHTSSCEFKKTSQILAAGYG